MPRSDEFFVQGEEVGEGRAPRHDVYQWPAAAGKLENTMSNSCSDSDMNFISYLE